MLAAAVFYVETAGRSLEEIDTLFLEKPKILMGLDKEVARVTRRSAQDEETRMQAMAHLSEKDKMSLDHVERA